MSLELSIRPIPPQTAVVTFTGPLTLGTNLKTADARLQTAIEGGSVRLVLDLSGVPYMDSAGLGTLVHASGLVRERGGALRLAGVTERVAALLRMTLTDTFLPIDTDVDAGLTGLG